MFDRRSTSEPIVRGGDHTCVCVRAVTPFMDSRHTPHISNAQTTVVSRVTLPRKSASEKTLATGIVQAVPDVGARQGGVVSFCLCADGQTHTRARLECVEALHGVDDCAYPP